MDFGYLDKLGDFLRRISAPFSSTLPSFAARFRLTPRGGCPSRWVYHHEAPHAVFGTEHRLFGVAPRLRSWRVITLPYSSLQYAILPCGWCSTAPSLQALLSGERLRTAYPSSRVPSHPEAPRTHGIGCYDRVRCSAFPYRLYPSRASHGIFLSRMLPAGASLVRETFILS